MAPEKENIGLTVHKNLVAYNGPDGVGKDVILEIALEKLGQGKIMVVDPDPLKMRHAGQAKMVQKIGVKPTDEKYSIGYWLAVPTVEQSLKSGEIVVVKRPLNTLMHSIKRGSASVDHFKRLIASGRATRGLWPAVWIEITASPEDIFANLEVRKLSGDNTSSDPRTLEEVKRSLEAQRQVLEFVRSVQMNGTMRVVEISNSRVEDPQQRGDALRRLADRVIENLPLN